MGLKQMVLLYGAPLLFGFNRTNMGLKLLFEQMFDYCDQRFNRTNMGLKRTRRDVPDH